MPRSSPGLFLSGTPLSRLPFSRRIGPWHGIVGVLLISFLTADLEAQLPASRVLSVDPPGALSGKATQIEVLWRTSRRGEWTYFILCLSPFFMLAFHAAVSVSITRYSIPLIPVLSLAMGVAFLRLGTRLSLLKARFARPRKTGSSCRHP